MPTPSGLTPEYAFPYLLESDPPDVATASQDIAQAVENVLKAMRIGQFVLSAGALPAGAVAANGAVLSQTGTYAALFAAIGTTWNTGGEGAGNFRLPNLVDRFMVGAGNLYAIGAKAGAANVTLTTGMVPQITATVSLPSLAHSHGGVTGNPTVDHTHNTPADTAIEDPGSTLNIVTSAGTGVTFSAQVTGGANNPHSHTIASDSITGASGSVTFGSASPTPVPTLPPYGAVNVGIWFQ